MGNLRPPPLNDSLETFKKLFILTVQVFQRWVTKKISDLRTLKNSCPQNSQTPLTSWKSEPKSMFNVFKYCSVRMHIRYFLGGGGGGGGIELDTFVMSQSCYGQRVWLVCFNSTCTCTAVAISWQSRISIMQHTSPFHNNNSLLFFHENLVVVIVTKTAKSIVRLS